MHLTSSPIDWYAARAGGVAAYVLLTLNVSIGLLMTGKKTMKHWPRAWKVDLITVRNPEWRDLSDQLP